MHDLEKFWRNASPATPVCTVTGATKNMVLNAVTAGAKDLDSLKNMVNLCHECGCTKTNPSGHDCAENAVMLLSIYAPVYEIMTEGRGCCHKNIQDTSATESCARDCKNCN